MPSTYWIVPATTRVLWFFIPIAIIMVGVLALLAAGAAGTQRSRIELHEDRLRVRGDLYGRAIAYDRLIIENARLVNLHGEPALMPVSRRVGSGLPGYRAGWFRLRNGRKALIYVTDMTRVLFIPTREDYDILFSAQQPDRLLEELIDRAGA